MPDRVAVQLLDIKHPQQRITALKLEYKKIARHELLKHETEISIKPKTRLKSSEWIIRQCSTLRSKKHGTVWRKVESRSERHCSTAREIYLAAVITGAFRKTTRPFMARRMHSERPGGSEAIATRSWSRRLHRAGTAADWFGSSVLEPSSSVNR